MKNLKKPETISLIVILLFLGYVSVVTIRERTLLTQQATCASLDKQLATTVFSLLPKNMQAKAVFAYDFTKQKTLYETNANTPLALASLTKLMTTRLALKQSSPETLYTLQKNDFGTEGSIGMKTGQTYTVGDLAKAALIASSNDAVTGLAQSTKIPLTTFPTLMNYEAKTLGLTTMTFTNPTGLDDDDHLIPKNLGSAHDILSLLYKDYSDYPTVYAVSTSVTDTIQPVNAKTTISLHNTDIAIGKLSVLIASKTGYTDTAGGNLAILWREPKGELLGAAVLGSTKEGRFDNMIAIHKSATMLAGLDSSMPSFCK